MDTLDSPVRNYAWGSRVALAQLRGEPAPSAEPEAELWMGAHPSAPSRLAGRPLTDVIAADPIGVLGAPIVERFGSRLPFLLKVLAAERPLSLQAHPDLAQAQAGYAAETGAGEQRNYVDAWHKPEMLVAVTQFDALCGFRDPRLAAEDFAALGVPGLKSIVDALRAPDIEEALRRTVRRLLSDTEPALIRDTVAACAYAMDTQRPAYRLAAELAAVYPDDAGVLVAMLLNQVRLAPGEAIWMPAGNLHAYLYGVGVEIMAASDNVLRGGLTPKRVDVEELLRVLRFEVLDEPVIPAVRVGPQVRTWSVPVDDFKLYQAVLDDGCSTVTLPGGGPRIVLCLDGAIEVDDGVHAVRLTAGQAAFAPADRAPLVARGAGALYQAGPGL